MTRFTGINHLAMVTGDMDMTSSPSQISLNTQEGSNHALFHFSIKYALTRRAKK